MALTPLLGARKEVTEGLANAEGKVLVDVELGPLSDFSHTGLVACFARSGGMVSVAPPPEAHPTMFSGQRAMSRLVELKKSRLDARRQSLGQPDATFVLVGDSAINVSFAATYPGHVDSIFDTSGIDPQFWSSEEWQARALLSLLPLDELRKVLEDAGDNIAALNCAFWQSRTGGLHLIKKLPELFPDVPVARRLANVCQLADTRKAEHAIKRHGIPVTTVRGQYNWLLPLEAFHRRAERMGVAEGWRVIIAKENLLAPLHSPDSIHWMIATHMVAAHVRNGNLVDLDMPQLLPGDAVDPSELVAPQLAAGMALPPVTLTPGW